MTKGSKMKSCSGFDVPNFRVVLVETSVYEQGAFHESFIAKLLRSVPTSEFLGQASAYGA
jgi:hypothetical protein